MKNKVCLLTTAHDALDVRIFYKECKSLSEDGYRVYLIASHEKDETVDGINIVSLHLGGSRVYRFLVKGWAALWKAVKLNADVYHFHDPDLIPAGLLLKLFGKKVIYDVHEDVPKDILSKEWIGNLAIRKIVSFLFLKFLKFSSLFFDKIIAATPGISKGFSENRTTVLRNVPYYSFIDSIRPEAVVVTPKSLTAFYEPRIKTVPSVIYAGGLTAIRGIREIIEAVGLLDGAVELWLLGWWEDHGYERECKSLCGWKHVRYFGARSLNETYAMMKQADIGIINFLPVPNSVESLPNKVFEYLTCRLPVIMSEFEYWKELFVTCAVFANPADPPNIAEKIKSLLENPALKSRLVNEGRRLIENEYSWESESKKLIELYKSLMEEC